MKGTKVKLYLYVVFLFILTFLLASRIISGIKTHEFDYIKIVVNAIILLYVVYQVIKLGKIENDITDKKD